MASVRTKHFTMIVLLEDEEGKRHPIEALLIAVHSSLIRNIFNLLNVCSFLSFAQDFMIHELEDQCRKLINTFQTEDEI